MPAHRLDPLLRPASIAVVGASGRPGTVGHDVLLNLQRGGFAGRLLPVNPKYPELLGLRCYPDLASIGAAVDHVIFAVADTRIEAALEDAIAAGARAASIYSTLVLQDDTEPPLRERIRARALAAGLLLCGGNGMGFYNFRDGVWACGFETRAHGRDGEVALLSQSGSGMSAILDCEARLRFSFAASTGQELLLGVEDFLDFVLEQPETRAVGLFLETSRKPAALQAAFARARERGIPVVVVKVGRTGLAADMALSHSGALAGEDAAYQAVFDRHGVQRVDDLDTLATTLQLFAQPHRVGRGGLVTLHDSGGERSLLIDLAAARGTPLTELAPSTRHALEQILDPGLPAVNPLDAWSAGGADWHGYMTRCFATLLADPDAALGAVVHARGPDSSIPPPYEDYLRGAHEATGKPVCLVHARQGSGADPLAIRLSHAGFPVIDGVPAFLTAARCLFAWRDHRARPAPQPPTLDAAVIERWRRRLQDPRAIGEAEASVLLDAAGIPMAELCSVRDEATLLAAAAEMDWPLVLKTAAPGIQHKTDTGGVVLGLRDEAALCAAYAQMSARLGPAALLAPMIDATGVEMILGMTRDAQFGPLVVLGIGGVQAELLEDVVVLLPPFDEQTARHALGRLRMRPMLDGFRSTPPVDVDALCRAAARLSVLADALRDSPLEAIDVNPVRVLPRGCIGLDALISAASAPHD